MSQPTAATRPTHQQLASQRAERHWAAILDQFDRAGLTPSEFIKRGRLSPSGFYTWRRRLRPLQDNAASNVSPQISPPPEAKTIRSQPRETATKKPTPKFIELAVADAVKALPDAAASESPIAALSMIFTGLGQLLQAQAGRLS